MQTLTIHSDIITSTFSTGRRTSSIFPFISVIVSSSLFNLKNAIMDKLKQILKTSQTTKILGYCSYYFIELKVCFFKVLFPGIIITLWSLHVSPRMFVVNTTIQLNQYLKVQHEKKLKVIKNACQ